MNSVYFVPTALQQNVGLPRFQALVIGGCIQVMFVIGSFYPVFFTDRVGRRKPMMWGSFGLAISMMLIAVLLSFRGTSVQKQTSSAAIAFFFTYMLIFGASVNCIPWVYVPEILPLHARAKGTAIGISSNWIWNFFIVLISPIILNRLNWKAYLIFMCTNAAFVPLVYFCYPETSLLSLEEIDYIFSDTNSIKEEIQLSKDMRKRKLESGDRRSTLLPGAPDSRRETLVGNESSESKVVNEKDIRTHHDEGV